MSHLDDRRRERSRDDIPRSVGEPSSEAAGIPVEEGEIRGTDLFGRPAGIGTEASTSNQTSVDLDSYTVPDGSVAMLRSATLDIQSNGEASLHVSGTDYGPFTGPVEVEIPLDPGRLAPGYQVSVTHRSTDGTETTTRALLTVLEV